MRRGLVVFITVVVSLAVVSGLVLVADSALAEDVPVIAKLRGNLDKQGVNPTNISLQDGTLEVQLLSDSGGTPDDPWSRTLVVREVAFLSGAGELPADYLEITLVDDDGGLVYEYGSPIEGMKRSACEEIPPVELESTKAELAPKATKYGISIDSVSMASSVYQGIAIEVKSTLVSNSLVDQEEALRWGTVQLLSQLRLLRKESGQVEADLYRLIVSSAKGDVMVSYVVEPKARVVRVWLAPGVSPMWQ